MNKLIDRTIMVIGASGKIGKVLSSYFLAEGANVVISARNPDRLTELKQELDSERVLDIPVDATVPADCEKLFASGQEKFGKIDTVVISAGTWQRLNISDSAVKARESFDALYTSIFLPSAIAAFTGEASCPHLCR